ncbi:MAG TPA: DUF167 domain-containing protein [bacterium]|nr:DUF167 domain-containing protein [bacterium]
MKYKVLVKPNKKEGKVYWDDRTLYSNDKRILVIESKEPPVDGRANRDVIQMISDFLDVPKCTVSIKRGKKSNLKTIIVEDIY